MRWFLLEKEGYFPNHFDYPLVFFSKVCFEYIESFELLYVELAEGSMRGGTTSVSLHYHITGKLNMCTCFSNKNSYSDPEIETTHTFAILVCTRDRRNS